MARRRHFNALQTNEIPQQTYPFTKFITYPLRTEKFYRSGPRNPNKPRKIKNKGSKEIMDPVGYGKMKYAPRYPVKKVHNSRVYDVLEELNPGTHAVGVKVQAH